MLDFGPCFGYDSSCLLRGVAQFGRALRSGRRGRGFESRRLDYLAGATGNADFIGVSGSFFVPATLIPKALFSYVLSPSSNFFLTFQEIANNKRWLLMY